MEKYVYEYVHFSDCRGVFFYLNAMSCGWFFSLRFDLTGFWSFWLKKLNIFRLSKEIASGRLKIMCSTSVVPDSSLSQLQFFHLCFPGIKIQFHSFSNFMMSLKIHGSLPIVAYIFILHQSTQLHTKSSHPVRNCALVRQISLQNSVTSSSKFEDIFFNYKFSFISSSKFSSHSFLNFIQYIKKKTEKKTSHNDFHSLMNRIYTSFHNIHFYFIFISFIQGSFGKISEIFSLDWSMSNNTYLLYTSLIKKFESEWGWKWEIKRSIVELTLVLEFIAKRELNKFFLLSFWLNKKWCEMKCN